MQIEASHLCCSWICTQGIMNNGQLRRLPQSGPGSLGVQMPKAWRQMLHTPSTGSPHLNIQAYGFQKPIMVLDPFFFLAIGLHKDTPSPINITLLKEEIMAGIRME